MRLKEIIERLEEKIVLMEQLIEERDPGGGNPSPSVSRVLYRLAAPLDLSATLEERLGMYWHYARILSCTPHFARILGVKPGDLVGAPLKEIMNRNNPQNERAVRRFVQNGYRDGVAVLCARNWVTGEDIPYRRIAFGILAGGKLSATLVHVIS